MNTTADAAASALTYDAIARDLAPETRVELPASRIKGWPRHFFFGIGLFCILLAILGFAPSMVAYFIGEYHFPAIVHAHAVIMLGWLVLFTIQARLVQRGSLATHRRLGIATATWAVLVWLAMGVATIVALKRYDPDEMAFLVKPLLIQLGTMVVFPAFVISAVIARRHAGWHKRLMALATFVLVQAALDRMHWLPNEGLPMFWHHGVRLYVLLLLPLAVFDIATLRRIHPATLTGAGVIVAMHGVVSFGWDNEGWNQIARGFWMWLR